MKCKLFLLININLINDNFFFVIMLCIKKIIGMKYLKNFV